VCSSDLEVDFEGLWSVLYAGTREYSLPIPEPAPRKDHRDWVAMREIPASIARLQAELRVLEQLREARKALREPESAQAAVEIAEIQNKIFRLRTEPYRRWANGFSCLFFALIGAPVAMLRRHADVLTNFFSCFLPILVVYYPLLMFGEDLSTSGKLPPISFWMANMVLVVPAVALLRRTIRH
jgi:lipopolysaccharide export system permease protein